MAFNYPTCGQEKQLVSSGCLRLNYILMEQCKGIKPGKDRDSKVDIRCWGSVEVASLSS